MTLNIILFPQQKLYLRNKKPVEEWVEALDLQKGGCHSILFGITNMTCFLEIRIDIFSPNVNDSCRANT